MTRQQPLAPSAAICSVSARQNLQINDRANVRSRDQVLSVVDVETLIADKINRYLYANTLMIPAALRNLIFTKSTNFEIIIAQY